MLAFCPSLFPLSFLPKSYRGRHGVATAKRERAGQRTDGFACGKCPAASPTSPKRPRGLRELVRRPTTSGGKLSAGPLCSPVSQPGGIFHDDLAASRAGAGVRQLGVLGDQDAERSGL